MDGGGCVRMIGTEYLLADREGFAEPLHCSRQVSSATQHIAKLIEAGGSMRMVRAEQPLADRQRTFGRYLRFLILATLSEEEREFVERLSRLRMFGPQHSLANCQGSLVESLG